jgi:hypothetical protein
MIAFKTALFFLGLCCISYGVGRIYFPLGVIIAGAFLIWTAFLLSNDE